MKKRTIYGRVILIALSANICILILLSTVFGCLFWNYSKTEKIQSTMMELDAVESACGILLEGVYENMAYFSGGADLDNFNSALKDVSKAENIIIIRNMTQNMQNFINTNNHIFSMYLYIEDSNWVLTSDGKVVKGDEFYDYDIINYYNQKRKAGESTGSLVSRIPRRQSYTTAENYEQHAVISLCSPLMAYTTKLNGLLIINLYESSVSNIINGEQANDEDYVYMMNSDGMVLSHTIRNNETGAVSDKVSQEIIASNKEKGYVFDNINGKKALVSYKKSQIHNLIYIGVQYFSSLIGRLVLMIILSLCAILIVALLSVIVVYSTTKKVVAPMNRLVDEMRHKAEIESPVEIDEVDILKAAYNVIDQKAKQMETILIRSKDVMREHVLTKMVTAQTDATDKKYILEVFPHESCTVLLVVIDRYSEFSALHSMEQIKIMQETILHNVKKQLAKYNYIVEGFWQSDGSIVIVVNLSSQDAEQFYNIAVDEYRQLADAFMREYGVSISMSAGNIYSRQEAAA
ncbi:MAG: hypothetical protein IJ365_02850, partial [Clostridia bacterium]|nr:hypothetical protein [Clostridia bacterium]